MGDWSKHGSATGGYYQCNLYEEEKKNNSNLAAMERAKEAAVDDLTRFTWHFERY